MCKDLPLRAISLVRQDAGADFGVPQEVLLDNTRALVEHHHDGDAQVR